MLHSCHLQEKYSVKICVLSQRIGSKSQVLISTILDLYILLLMWLMTGLLEKKILVFLNFSNKYGVQWISSMFPVHQCGEPAAREDAQWLATKCNASTFTSL